MLNSLLEDLKEDEERKLENTDNGFIFTSKVHYPNNKNLVKQNIYMDKNSKVSKVEVVDKDDNVLISMAYNKIEYDKKFNDNYFELSSIIKVNDNKNSDKEIKNNNEIKQNSSNESIGNSNSEVNDDAIKNNYSSSNNETNNNVTTTQPNNNNEIKTKETLSIDDVIYPMYLPDNTYLTSQKRIDTDSGERLILTFGGDKPFVLVEETISNNNSNVVIPVNGEFDFFADVIGVIGTNSVMWHSNGVEYYMTSNVIETSVLVDIARSISVLPVSK